MWVYRRPGSSIGKFEHLNITSAMRLSTFRNPQPMRTVSRSLLLTASARARCSSPTARTMASRCLWNLYPPIPLTPLRRLRAAFRLVGQLASSNSTGLK